VIIPSQIEVPDRVVVSMLRLMTEAQRLAIANGMWVSARRAVECIVRSEHANFTEAQMRQEIARRMLRGAV
jgi:hypothetical protein